mmetsp:Transcript_5314/g.18078  ORF Transcript_5314/g.18078 Transcript_5314/m.18078 type:complete len:87 (-) Transcript_5314:914-1174(-)
MHYKSHRRFRSLAGRCWKVNMLEDAVPRTRQQGSTAQSSGRPREWKDGLLSSIMRDLGQIEDDKPKWYVSLPPAPFSHKLSLTFLG